MLRLVPFVAAALLLSAAALAQAPAGPYVSLGAGVNILQDEIAKPYGAEGVPKRSFRFDVGGAGNVAFGYGLGNGLRLEIEGDFADQPVKNVRFPNGAPGHAIGDEPEYGGFVNLAYDFNLGLPVVPYVGAGAGYQAIELHDVGSAPLHSAVIGRGATTEGAFAYQGMAGLSYPVLAIPGLSLTAEYRMIGVITPPPYPRSVRDADGTTHPGLLTLNNVFNHEALIGLRYSFGTPPPPPPPPSAPTEAAPSAPPTRTYLVFFDWDRADLTDRARQIVAEAAAASTHVPTTRIDVNGYTDLSGSADYNQRLSVRRAESVEAELVRDGVPKTEIVIRGFGETNPLVPTAKGVREPQNRRVEILLH
jgi:OOP family OmpA-OmpF porin